MELKEWWEGVVLMNTTVPLSLSLPSSLPLLPLPFSLPPICTFSYVCTAVAGCRCIWTSTRCLDGHWGAGHEASAGGTGSP